MFPDRGRSSLLSADVIRNPLASYNLDKEFHAYRAQGGIQHRL
jgi:hypothetical protein